MARKALVRGRASLIACVVLAALALSPVRVPAVAAAAELPNLSPQRPADIVVGNADQGGGRAIRFSITTDNLGPHHFDLLTGLPRDASRTIAQQCVQWNLRVCEARQDAGDFVFHAVHGHWHLADFALYELRAVRPDGTPDMSSEGLVRTGGKVSFCLLDYERGRGNRANDDFYPFTTFGFYLSCNGVSQGISAGWADTYENYLAGQQILIGGVADGAYSLVVTVDPVNRLLETTKADNLAFRTIRLSNGGASVVTVD